MRKTVPAVVAAILAVGGVAAGATAVAGGTAAASPVSAPAGAQPDSPGDGPGVAPSTEGSRTVSYGPHDKQRMDIYSPEGSRPARGAVVLVHGGSWVKGDKADFAPQGRQLAAAGYVAVSINYRLAADAAWPAQRDDAIEAVRWIRAHAPDLRVDPERVVLVGSSAGAHIATSAATVGAGSELVRGVVGLSGPLDPRRLVAGTGAKQGLGEIVTRTLLGCAPAQCADRYADATPQLQVDADDVPSLMFASRDEFVDPQHSASFVRQARSVGLESTMVYLAGDVHARWYWDRAWPQIRAWVAEKLEA